MIYLDNAATTKMRQEVLTEMMPYLTTEFGNPGSLHGMGRAAAAAVCLARERVAKFIGADNPEQILFTSGGSEANNLAMYWFEDKDFRYPPCIVTSLIEHDSMRKAVERAILHTPGSYTVTLSPDFDGEITEEELEQRTECCKKSNDAVFVSVMSANNELGTLNPVTELCKYAHNHGWLFHTDAVQAAGLYPLNVSRNGYDFVSVSSHKIHGPKGAGALYVKDPGLIRPLICGGSHQEFGKRAGTENVAAIVGFGKACELMSEGYEERSRHRLDLSGAFFRALIHGIGGVSEFDINGDPPLDFKTISLRFDGVDAQTLLLALDSRGICVSAGSACTAHEDTPSHVLKALGLTDEEARSSIRVSFSDANTEEEAAAAGRIIADCVKILRG